MAIASQNCLLMTVLCCNTQYYDETAYHTDICFPLPCSALLHQNLSTIAVVKRILCPEPSSLLIGRKYSGWPIRSKETSMWNARTWHWVCKYPGKLFMSGKRQTSQTCEWTQLLTSLSAQAAVFPQACRDIIHVFTKFIFLELLSSSL